MNDNDMNDDDDGMPSALEVFGTFLFGILCMLIVIAALLAAFGGVVFIIAAAIKWVFGS
jgi:hypothetical protein